MLSFLFKMYEKKDITWYWIGNMMLYTTKEQLCKIHMNLREQGKYQPCVLIMCLYSLYWCNKTRQIRPANNAWILKLLHLLSTFVDQVTTYVHKMLYFYISDLLPKPFYFTALKNKNKKKWHFFLFISVALFFI